MRQCSKALKFCKSIPYWVVLCSFLMTISLIFLFLNPYSVSTLIYLQKGIKITLYISFVAYLSSCLLGILIAMMRVSPYRILREFATLYVEIIRGLPILIILYYLAFVLIPLFVFLLNYILNPFITRQLLKPFHIQKISMISRAIIALTVAYSAFISEIFRAGIQSIDRGQYEAGKVLGLNHNKILFHIILPQAIRRVSPALVNEFIALIKNSSLVSVLGVADITQLGKLRSASSFKFFETYSVVTFLYLSLTLILSGFSKLLKKFYHQNSY